MEVMLKSDICICYSSVEIKVVAEELKEEANKEKKMSYHQHKDFACAFNVNKSKEKKKKWLLIR